MLSKIVTYRGLEARGPQLGPQISIRKGAQQYFLFKNGFGYIFKTILSFKSFKNTVFRDF